jgi:hypothetical protein
MKIGSGGAELLHADGRPEEADIIIIIIIMMFLKG